VCETPAGFRRVEQSTADFDQQLTRIHAVSRRF
jgi:hypothetical protein